MATDSAGYSRTDTVTNRRVDNTAPTASMTDPGSPLTGTVRRRTATDAGRGVADVVFEYRVALRRLDHDLHRRHQPYGCPWNTTAVADGLYDLRTTATDNAGNPTSSPVYNRRVDNTAPTVTITDPARR